MKENEKYVRFYELFTEYGILYTYETYQNNPNNEGQVEIPVIREFFTGEKASRGYTTLSFMEGKCVFDREIRGYDGLVIKDYYKELSPHKFLNKVFPYLKDDQTREKKANKVYDIFKNKINNARKPVIIQKEEITEKQENDRAKKILKKYMK